PERRDLSGARHRRSWALPARGGQARGALRLPGITFTYNEPTIFIEYALDIVREARQAGLFANFVTNGYMSPEAVRAIGPHLDAVSVDFKASGEAGFMAQVRRREGRRAHSW
ncbi:pyruvate-formate lyase-activating enzyme, partial [mine drainage metagenome]